MKNKNCPALLLDSSPEERRGFLKKLAALAASVSALGGFTNLRAKNTFSGKEISTYISTSSYLGSIGLFAGNFSIRDCAICNGGLTPISANNALFAILGTTFGGDGRVTFALPDFRGRVPIGQGQGPGLADRPLGQIGGTNLEELSAWQLPSHNHSATFLEKPSYTMRADTSKQSYSGDVLGEPEFFDIYSNNQANTAMGSSALSNISKGFLTLESTGVGNPHNNIQPSLVLNYQIVIEGLFPPRT